MCKPTFLNSVTLLIFSVFLSCSICSCSPGSIFKRPAELSSTGVRVGSGFVTSSSYINDGRLGQVNNIVWQSLEVAQGPVVGIAGQDLVLFADKSGTVIRDINFPSGAATGTSGMSHLDFVDIEGDGNCEFLLLTGSQTKAVMLDHNGVELWDYSYNLGIDDFACGDINNDGFSETVFGMNGFGGLAMVDHNGVEQWLKKDDETGNCWHVELFDTDGNSTPEIVHTNSGGNLVIRDTSGNVIRTVSSFTYYSYFTTAELPSYPGQVCVLQPSDNEISIDNIAGRSSDSLPTEEIPRPNMSFATTVLLDTTKTEYVAVLVDFSLWDRASLYLFDDQDKLVYWEVLEGTHSALAAVPADSSGRETLLVGSNNEVLRYDK